MDYLSILLYTYLALLCAIIIVILCNSYYFKYIYVYFKKDIKIEKSDKLNKYVVLIPARNESKVIRNILNSLKNQTYNKDMFDVYVITQDENDPTNKIVGEYGYHYFLRTNLKNRARKGYALQECYEYLVQNNIQFDSVVIFDADNILSPEYLTELNNLKNMGYQVGVGLRESSNANTNFISATSALLFTFQSTFINKCRSIIYKKIMISGTGYFMDKQVIDEAGGRIWTGLTEDVQLTRYCYRNGVKMGYNPNAIYYDEQPTDLKTLHNQHVRWVWGFMGKDMLDLGVNKKPKYKKTPLLGRWEFFFSINLFQLSEWCVVFHMLTIIVFIIYFLVIGAYQNIAIYAPFILVDIILMFFICSVACFIEMLFSGKNFKVSRKLKIMSVLFGFIFWTDWLLAWLDGFFNSKKRKTWVSIEHKGGNNNIKTNK